MTGTVKDLTLELDQVDGVDTLQLINNSDPDPATQVVASQALSDTSTVEIIGSELDDTFTIDFTTPFSVPISFMDSSSDDSDTLRVLGGDQIWQISGTDAGIVATIEFGGVENLAGGDGDDTFVFQDGWGIDTVVDSSGTDTLDFSAVTVDLTFTLHGNGTISVSDGTNSASNVANIENLAGGSGNNTFVVEQGATISGSVDGGLGTNILDFSAVSSDLGSQLGSHLYDP
jgi:hypothetical protein